MILALINIFREKWSAVIIGIWYLYKSFTDICTIFFDKEWTPVSVIRTDKVFLVDTILWFYFLLKFLMGCIRSNHRYISHAKLCVSRCILRVNALALLQTTRSSKEGDLYVFFFDSHKLSDMYHTVVHKTCLFGKEPFNTVATAGLNVLSVVFWTVISLSWTAKNNRLGEYCNPYKRIPICPLKQIMLWVLHHIDSVFWDVLLYL